MLNEHILHDIERLVSEDSMRELMFNMVNAQGGTTIKFSNVTVLIEY